MVVLYNQDSVGLFQAIRGYEVTEARVGRWPPILLLSYGAAMSYIVRGGGAPHARVLTQVLTPHCDQIVTVL